VDLIQILLVDDTPSELDPYLKSLRSRFAAKNINISIDIKFNTSEALAHLDRANPYDIVLIDIVGVAYEELLRGIRSLYPYLPIVMFSRQRIPDEIVKCIDMGAQSFIFKRDFRIGAEPIGPYDKIEDEMAWERAENKIRKLTDDYRHIKRILESSDEIGWIRKKGDKNSIIKDQINFLEFIKKDLTIAAFFPLVKENWEGDNYTSYEMPLYRMKSLRHLIFEESDKKSCIEISKKVLEQVLDFTFNQMYTKDVRQDIDLKFIDETYFNKYSSRLNQIQELVRELKNTNSSPALDAYERLLNSKDIQFEGKKLLNPAAILEQLKTDASFIKLLTPPFLTIIHGDLHFDNILVNDRLPKKIKIKLIDPRGFQLIGYPPGSGDVAYDIGKLLHSAHGYYDFIHEGYLTAEIGSFKYLKNGSLEVPTLGRQEWADVPHKGGGSGDIMTSHRRIVQSWTWDVFDELAQYIQTWIEKSDYSEKDPNWWLRSRFNEAMHFCTMGRFHIREDVGRVIAIQIRGIELMNEFIQDFKDRKSNVRVTS
jgi:thiamine kinase-like enzyme/CheY-like chemotaxis protein